jgi:hypothetical protein
VCRSWVTAASGARAPTGGTDHGDDPLDRERHHADRWTIAHLRGPEATAAKEFELVPNEAGYRELIAFARALGGTARFVYEAGSCGYDLYVGSTVLASDATAVSQC